MSGKESNLGQDAFADRAYIGNVPVLNDISATVIRVCDYVSSHLDEDLTVEHLSGVAGYSKYHFHRLFREFVGVNLTAYVQLARLKRASYRLVFHPECSVIEIALEARFESPESFSRAFKRNFGQTPTAFRRDPQWEPWHESYQFRQIAKGVPMNIKIVDFPTTPIAALEHQGSPESLMNTVQRFKEWRKSTGLSPVGSQATYGVVYNDPDSVPPAEFRFDVCGAVSSPIPSNPQGVKNKEIPAGRCAVLRHLGSRDLIGESVRAMYRDWLPGSGENPRDFPIFFHYLNLFPEVPECDLQTDIYLPLE